MTPGRVIGASRKARKNRKREPDGVWRRWRRKGPLTGVKLVSEDHQITVSSGEV